MAVLHLQVDRQATHPSLANSTNDGNFSANAEMLNLMKERVDVQANSINIIDGTIGL